MSDADQARVLSAALPSADLPPKTLPDRTEGRHRETDESPDAFYLTGGRPWTSPSGRVIVYAEPVQVDGDFVYLIPGPRDWVFANGSPVRRMLHVIRQETDGRIMVRLKDPTSGEFDEYKPLSGYSAEDQEYIGSLRKAVSQRPLEDLTDPKRGYLSQYGILWRISIRALSEQDRKYLRSIH
ncbi:MAG: hypothetical protein KDA89_14575 [Planctomycetaceae bacterium]|nr:hypothetical protein [Planctomycetaceae bacterium]